MQVKVIVYNLLIIVLNVNAEQCTTPNNESGECILLTSCPPLLEMFTNNTSLEFVRKSICGYISSDSKVCCNYHTKDKLQDENGNKKGKPLLSDRRYCGYQHSDDYFRNTTSSASITEFPWLARLVHKKNSTSGSIKKLYSCAGSLISARYVLTAAHCLQTNYGLVTEIELGEYHVINKTDCVVETSVRECSDPVDVYRVEGIVVHPKYSEMPLLNDIALIRLNRQVTYTDYIRPICLPYPETKSAETGDILTTSGWGFTHYEQETAKIKKSVLNTIISNTECAKAYKQIREVILTENQFCTTKAENSTEFTCQGDSGAPVMFSQRLQWHQEGIVSNGKAQCGGDAPVIHTKVRKYLNWIEENINP